MQAMNRNTHDHDSTGSWRPPHWALLTIAMLAAAFTTAAMFSVDPRWAMAAFVGLCVVTVASVALLCRAAWTRYVDDWPGITDVTALVPSACVIAVTVAGRHLF